MSDNIPLDVQLDIMNRLPVKTILQLRSVSKIWKANIDSHAFIKACGAKDSADCLFCLTFDQVYKGFMCSVDSKLTITPVDTHMNLAAMMPVGSCSGITFFLYGGNVMAVLWNPSLRKSVCIFIPYYTNQIECSKICFGFGVRPDTLDPTIVNVSYPVFHSGYWYVSVFSLNALSWKRLEIFSCHPISRHRDTIPFESRYANAIFFVRLRELYYHFRDDHDFSHPLVLRVAFRGGRCIHNKIFKPIRHPYSYGE
ncbi:F-box domain-containing protein [Artemisia annua]|uniref:F-box domain-containing protein n=1 Tax=Artemisia annua TaxID=35608 RepID=A0A2U1NUG2_ARTAN|nr:F-box domain-containing protein [Artemisia annua]